MLTMAFPTCYTQIRNMKEYWSYTIRHENKQNNFGYDDSRRATLEDGPSFASFNLTQRTKAWRNVDLSADEHVNTPNCTGQHVLDSDTRHKGKVTDIISRNTTYFSPQA
jgi:hypothetical protein